MGPIYSALFIFVFYYVYKLLEIDFVWEYLESNLFEDTKNFSKSYYSFML